MEVERVPLNSLKPHPRNPRQGDIGAISESLKAHGQYRPIVVQRSTGHILAGNHTWKAAKALKWKEIATVFVDVSDDEAYRILLVDNRSGDLADYDNNELVALLQELTATELGLEGTGYDGDALDELLRDLGLDEDKPDPAPQMDRAAELRERWGTERGQVWAIPSKSVPGKSHRLMCGDSTSTEDVARLMCGEKADLCLTSPPYNSGNGGYKTDYHGKTKRFYTHQGDDRTEDEWVEFCGSVLRLVAANLRADTSPVIWNVMYTANCRSGYGRTMFAYDHGLSVKETICWDKGMGFPSASRGILSRNWELVFVLSQGEKYTTTQGENEPRWAKWDISRPREQSESHKATFPAELAQRAMRDFSTGGVCYDPFLGSGTTMVAAENERRVCYGMEIDPGYCAVILQRMTDMGLAPQKVDNG